MIVSYIAKLKIMRNVSSKLVEVMATIKHAGIAKMVFCDCGAIALLSIWTCDDDT